MSNVIAFPNKEVEFGTMFVHCPAAWGCDINALAINLSTKRLAAITERMDLLDKFRRAGEPMLAMVYEQIETEDFYTVKTSKNEMVHQTIMDTFDAGWAVTPYTTDYVKGDVVSSFAHMVISEGEIHWEIFLKDRAYQTTVLSRANIVQAGSQRFRPGSDPQDGSQAK